MDKDNASEIAIIRQERAAADKRLLRYRQAAEQIRQRNRALLAHLGFDSFEDVEKTLMENEIHPEGAALFRKTLEARGKNLPESLSRILMPEKEPSPEEPAPDKKEKRVKFKL